MKKIFKFSIAISIIGMMIFLVGYHNGGAIYARLSDTNFLINNTNLKMNEHEEANHMSDNIKSIDVDLEFSDIIFINENISEFKVNTCYTDELLDFKPTIKEEGGRLIIQNDATGKNFSINTKGETQLYEIEITGPLDKLESMDIKTKFCSCFFKDSSIKKLNLSTKFSDIEIRNSTLSNSNINTSMSRILFADVNFNCSNVIKGSMSNVSVNDYGRGTNIIKGKNKKQETSNLNIIGHTILTDINVDENNSYNEGD